MKSDPSVALLLSVLAVLTLVLVATLAVRAWQARARPRLEAVGFSAVANFFDALGIGSFAPTTAYLKLRRLVPDELIPHTMLAGYATASATEAFVYITSIEVDPLLLWSCIVASSVGSLAGVFIAPDLPVRLIRTTIGVGLLIAALMYALSNLGLMPQGGVATSLGFGPLVFAVVLSAFLGVLMNLGIGNFAPTLIALSLLGLDPRAAFPIMMGSAAFLMVSSGVKIIRDRPLDRSIVLGMAIGGVPGVLVAAYVLNSLPLVTLRWCVVVIVAYTGAIMLRAALNSRSTKGAVPA